MTLKDVRASSKEGVENKLKLEISKLFSDHEYLLGYLHSLANSQQVNYKEKKRAEKLLKKYEKIYNDDAKEATAADLKDSIRFLSELLHKPHGQRVYILIDEYDKPVNYLLERDILQKDKASIKEVADLVSGMLSE